MHKYMRAIGFSKYTDRKKMKDLLTETIMNSERRAYTLNQDEIMMGEFCKDFGEQIGLAVCGEFDEEDKFVYEYYYPYLIGTGVTTYEDISVDRHAAKDSYAGICDDMNLGITIIFYLQNMMEYVKSQIMGKLPVKGTSLTLSGLSISGSIMMAIQKDEKQKDKVKKKEKARQRLIDMARKGNEEAIETLTLEDMDTYSVVSNRVQKEDIFSIVDTYFMPYGVECDQYSVLGEIVNMKKTTNRITDEEIYILTISCNELTFDVCINIIDLFGEPQIGRRFKGVVWLQGFINFPDAEGGNKTE